MKELVIISGKGGTGKTTVVAALAALAEEAVLADCDVDAADLHLLIEPRIRRREVFRSGHTAVIRAEDCTQCGVCSTHCRFKAIRTTRDPNDFQLFTVDPIACEGCSVCVRLCPAGAIDFPENTCGEWFISDTRHGPMVHAKLGIAEENSGRLVTLVRQTAKEVAEAEGRSLLLVDGPPGIGCPVIASITGASLILIVTEPTVAGMHDLERVLALVEHFGVPATACVNKFDINPTMTEAIEEQCHRRAVPIVARIPYSQEVTQAMIARTSVIEHGVGPVAEELARAWKQIRTELGRDGQRTSAHIPSEDERS